MSDELKAECDHGIVFDEAEADRLLKEPGGCAKIRRRFPRLDGPCPKGCGFNGIGYASLMHYVAGDW